MLIKNACFAFSSGFVLLPPHSRVRVRRIVESQLAGQERIQGELGSLPQRHLPHRICVINPLLTNTLSTGQLTFAEQRV